jgi:arylsulfatase A-like enzyme
MDWKQRGDPPLPIILNNDVVIAPVNQDNLTKLCTDKAIEFINSHSNEPFFAYIPYNMPHNPLHASDDFRGNSANDIYGDAIEEMDYSIGRIISLLDSLNIFDNTIFVFTSDNGAAKPFGGSNLPLTGWKGSNFEGGFRVPCVIKWTKSVTLGSEIDYFVNIMDFLPTFAELIGYDLPVDRTIDGKSILELLLTGEDTRLENREFYYYYRDQLQAVRKGDWKLFLPLRVQQTRWNEIMKEGPGQDLKLVNLRTDLQEQNDLSDEFPEKLEELMKLAEIVRVDLGDNENQGVNQRPAGWIDNPKYMIINK